MEIAATRTADTGRVGPVRVIAVWTASFLASFVLVGAIGVIQIGSDAFWQHLRHPTVDGPAFDLLCATVAGTYGVALTVYFAGVVTFAATVSSKSEIRRDAVLRSLGNWWLFFPSLFWYVAVNLLVGGAWGFPRFWAGILALIAIGPFAMYGFAKAAISVLRVFDEDYHAPSGASAPGTLQGRVEGEERAARANPSTADAGPLPVKSELSQIGDDAPAEPTAPRSDVR